MSGPLPCPFCGVAMTVLDEDWCEHPKHPNRVCPAESIGSCRINPWNTRAGTRTPAPSDDNPIATVIAGMGRVAGSLRATRLAPAPQGAEARTKLREIADRLEQIGERVRGVTEGFDPHTNPAAFLGNNVLYEAAEIRKLAGALLQEGTGG